MLCVNLPWEALQTRAQRFSSVCCMVSAQARGMETLAAGRAWGEWGEWLEPGVRKMLGISLGPESVIKM